MSAILPFLRSRKFLLHLLVIMSVIFVLFFAALKWLDSFTSHGQFVTVPDFTGQKLTSLVDFVKDKSVMYQIVDSIYDPKEKPGMVLRQDPDPGSHVKHNRTVYLYVTGMVPPRVPMPRLLDRSERQARFIISSYGLKLGRVTEKEADCNGCVIAQLINGKEISPGKQIKKGSVVDLCIGTRDKFAARDTTEEEEPN
jgi:beta-lactam-binding protein with PASTA domain